MPPTLVAAPTFATENPFAMQFMDRATGWPRLAAMGKKAGEGVAMKAGEGTCESRRQV